MLQCHVISFINGNYWVSEILTYYVKQETNFCYLFESESEVQTSLRNLDPYAYLSCCLFLSSSVGLHFSLFNIMFGFPFCNQGAYFVIKFNSVGG